MVRIGAPLEARAPFAGAKGDRRQMMDVLGGAMAALLPQNIEACTAAADRHVDGGFGV